MKGIVFYVSCVRQIQHMLYQRKTLQLIDWFAKLHAGSLKLVELQRKAFQVAHITFNQLQWPLLWIIKEAMERSRNII